MKELQNEIDETIARLIDLGGELNRLGASYRDIHNSSRVEKERKALLNLYKKQVPKKKPTKPTYKPKEGNAIIKLIIIENKGWNECVEAMLSKLEGK